MVDGDRPGDRIDDGKFCRAYDRDRDTADHAGHECQLGQSTVDPHRPRHRENHLGADGGMVGWNFWHAPPLSRDLCALHHLLWICRSVLEFGRFDSLPHAEECRRWPPPTPFDVADVPRLPAASARPRDGSLPSQPYGRAADRAAGRRLVGGNFWLAFGILRQHPDQPFFASPDHGGHASRTRLREARRAGLSGLYRVGRDVGWPEHSDLGSQQRYRMGLEVYPHLEPVWHRGGFFCRSGVRRAQHKKPCLRDQSFPERFIYTVVSGPAPKHGDFSEHEFYIWHLPSARTSLFAFASGSTARANGR